MYYSVDSVGIDFNPINNNRKYWIIYFVVFLIIGNTFFINLFVGVMISTFNREKDLLGKNFLLTPYQRMWV
jgi:Ion transport protein